MSSTNQVTLLAHYNPAIFPALVEVLIARAVCVA